MPTQNELELQNAELRRSIALSDLAVHLASRGMTPTDAVYFSKLVSSRITPSVGGVKVKDRQGMECTLEQLADEVSTLTRDLAVNEPRSLVPGARGYDEEVEEDAPRYDGYGPKKRLIAKKPAAAAPAVQNAAALANAERENATFRAITLSNL